MNNDNNYFETALIAGMIVLIGEAVCGQATVAAMIELAVAAALGLLAAVRLAKGEKLRARSAAVKALVFVGLFLVGTGLDVANKKIAMSRAETIIAACRTYKDKTGAYPETLQVLVPQYLPSIPRAKYTVLWGSFHYGEGRLAWMLIPMTVMPSYDLNAGKWSFAAQDALPAVLGKLKG
jgi:hypothetical protein